MNREGVASGNYPDQPGDVVKKSAREYPKNDLSGMGVATPDSQQTLADSRFYVLEGRILDIQAQATYLYDIVDKKISSLRGPISIGGSSEKPGIVPSEQSWLDSMGRKTETIQFTLESIIDIVKQL